MQRQQAHLQNSPSAKIRYQYMILLKNYFWNAWSYIYFGNRKTPFAPKIITRRPWRLKHVM